MASETPAERVVVRQQTTARATGVAVVTWQCWSGGWTATLQRGRQLNDVQSTLRSNIIDDDSEGAWWPACRSRGRHHHHAITIADDS